MTIAISIIYVLVGLATIGLILLHRGRGGGLSDMFGGGLSSSASSSTTMEQNLDRLTVVSSVIFGFLTLVLVFILSS